MEKEGSMMELESIPNDTENRQEEWYQQLSLDNVKAFIRSNIAAASRSFIAIGYYLKYARDKKLYEEDGHASIWEFAREEYGISKSTASRYMTMNDRFSEGGNSPIVAKAYRGYGKSQLQEMLYLNDEQLEQVTPDTQVKQIREIRQPVREVPYFELPGQLSIDDFPDVMPEPVEYQVQPAANTGSTVLSVKDFEADEQGIAISQQEEIRWNLEPADETRTEYCNAAARYFIQVFHDWMREDCEKRVMQISESEKQFKVQFRKNSNTSWYFKDPLNGRSAHVNLFDDFIQFFSGTNEWVGECEWFYLCRAVQVMWNEIALEEVQNLRSGTEPEPEIAMPESVSDEIAVDANTCPPDNSSCRRQEWETGPEEKEAGHKECEQCWEDWKNRQTVLNAAEVQQEELPEPNENWNLGDLPQVNQIVMAEMSSIPSDETIKKYIQVLARQEGGFIALIRLANQVRKALEEWAEGDSSIPCLTSAGYRTRIYCLEDVEKEILGYKSFLEYCNGYNSKNSAESAIKITTLRLDAMLALKAEMEVYGEEK